MVVESYHSFAYSRGIDLWFVGRCEVMTDFVPQYAKKVLNNLLSNALKFTPENGLVKVVVDRDGDQLLLDVSDTGKGMDDDTVSHIFEPFYQGSDRAHYVGTGVGLALVKQIIDAVKGTITVDSQLGKGTTFHISVPIHNRIKRQMSVERETNVPLLDEPSSAPEDQSGEDSACRLLVIEDNHDIAAYIGAQFTDSYSVVYASNGTEGLEKALRLVPDLIITDLMMPGMDGLEVCREIRKNVITNHIPIIVITAKVTEEDRVKGIEAGADAYLDKPFSADELRLRVQKLLDGRRLLQEKFMQAVVERKSDRKDNEPQLSKSDLLFLTRVTDTVYSQLNQGKDVDVSILASSMCMSNSQLYRKLVAVTGYRPMAYIRNIKIRKATKLLDTNPQMSLSEVAERCGFNDYSNFVRAFKSVCGVTPTNYKR
jgi:two-component system sensor histidine kinase ChiS